MDYDVRYILEVNGNLTSVGMLDEAGFTFKVEK